LAVEAAWYVVICTKLTLSNNVGLTNNPRLISQKHFTLMALPYSGREERNTI